MTHTDYAVTTIDPKTILPADEWKNPTLSHAKILALTTEYYKLLDNKEIDQINETVEKDQEIIAACEIVRTLSNKANRSEESTRDMLDQVKHAIFKRMQIMAAYVVPKYINPTQATSGKSR